MENLVRIFCAMAALLALTLLTTPGARADAAAGQATYKGKCAACHGADGKGDSAAGKAMGVHDFAAPDVQKMTDAELTQAIAQGKGKMPAYGKSLNDAQIADLVAYIRELGNKK
jgi:cytochrome c6